MNKIKGMNEKSKIMRNKILANTTCKKMINDIIYILKYQLNYLHNGNNLDENIIINIMYLKYSYENMKLKN